MIRRIALVLVLVGAIAPVVSSSRAVAEVATPIVTNGPASNRVDIAIVGDGYTLTDLPKYALDVARLMDGFFAQQPLKEYKRYFNVTKVDVVSLQSGVDHPERSSFRDTAFDGTYNCSGIQRLICADPAKVQAALARSLPPERYDIPLVIVNDSEYGGSGGGLTVVSTHADVVELALHELGHSFGHLADEYGGQNAASCGGVEPWQPNATSATQRDAIEWKHWIRGDTAVPTSGGPAGAPGLYEGAAHCDADVYRPTPDSKMRSLGRGFDPVNIEQLVKRVYAFVSPIDAVTPDVSSLPFLPGGLVPLVVTPMKPATHGLTVAWTIDGSYAGSGARFLLDLTELEVGSHEIVAKVRDKTSMVRSDPESLLVEYAEWTVNVDDRQPLSFVPTHDAFTSAGSSTRNYGTARTLKARGGEEPAMRSFLKFSVRGIGSSAPASVKVRLLATEGSVAGGALRAGASNYWRESTITHRHSPPVPAEVASSVAGVAAGGVVEFDVSDVVTGDGLYTFVLTSDSEDPVSYASAEHLHAPKLLVSTG